MQPHVARVLDDLARRGFARFGGAVGPALVAQLVSAAADLARRPSEGWEEATRWFWEDAWRPAHFRGGNKNSNYYDCLGEHAGFDAAAEAILATPAIRELLDAALGPDYRLWYAQLRWADPGGDEYVLHQDVYGELGLCVYLTDHSDDAGSIVFCPEAHRWPRALEVLPLLEPRFVRPLLAHVDGVAGDVVVFLNKTWHGRTSARGVRLVMLMSFIPPGPIEKGRRLPASTRDRLGPELRRVTDPRAGRSFGSRFPEVLPFTSSFERRTAAGDELTDEAREVILSYAWAACVAHAEGHPLGNYKRLVREVVTSSVISGALLEALREDFRRRAESAGGGARAYQSLCLTHALWNGDAEAARRSFDIGSALERDGLSDDPADEADSVVSFHAESGADEAAIAALTPGPPSCPGALRAAARALMPLVRLGRFEEASRLQALGYAGLSGHADLADAIGLHLEYLALRADPAPGLALFEQHIAMMATQRSDGAPWHFFSGAWLLFTRMQSSRLEAPRLPSPRALWRRVGHDELLCDLDAILTGLAERFDLRNGNHHRRTLLAALRASITRDPLPAPH